jgi:hypothetical protein
MILKINASETVNKSRKKLREKVEKIVNSDKELKLKTVVFQVIIRMVL